MKIFIEHRGSKRRLWLCLLAKSADEKRELEKLYCDAQENRGDYAYGTDTNIEWEQNNFKLMFMLRGT